MRSFLTTIALSLVPVFAIAQGGGPQQGNTTGGGTLSVDFNETTHLVFMREEEKLARDVYTTLGIKYPKLGIFGNITKSEETHTCAVCDTLTKYDIEDPVTNDNVGVFSGEDYGAYFTEKFEQLVKRGETSDLEALYVGAFIEELDMLDINYCPDIIIKTQDSIDGKESCGLVYTDNPDIQKLYSSLLDGSKSHLRAFVKLIEDRIGYGGYVAQILSQEEVNEILGR